MAVLLEENDQVPPTPGVEQSFKSTAGFAGVDGKGGGAGGKLSDA
jgi:hypothetical protein